MVKTSRPGKYALSQPLQNDWDVVFLTPHLSPADLSPVLSIERKLWNISVENQSFREQWSLETSRNTVFQSDSDHFLQENALGLTNTPPVGCEWHYNITRYHNGNFSCEKAFKKNKHYKLKRLKSCASECEETVDRLFAALWSGEVSRSLRYCNAKPTLDRTGASSWHSIPLQK